MEIYDESKNVIVFNNLSLISQEGTANGESVAQFGSIEMHKSWLEQEEE